jgi:hypothetical protein
MPVPPEQIVSIAIDSPVAAEEVSRTVVVSGTVTATRYGFGHIDLVEVRFGAGGPVARVHVHDQLSGPVSWSCSGQLPGNVQPGQTVAITATVSGESFTPQPLSAKPVDPDPEPPDPEPEPPPPPLPDPIPFAKSVTVNVRLRQPFVPGPVDRVFEPTGYLDELLSLANRYVRAGTAQAGPTAAELAGRVWQPLDRLTQPALYEQATATVSQPRIAVEVLRKALGTAAPAAIDRRGRVAAYGTLLLELGTTYSELRRAKIADAAERGSLAARLGLELGGSRPDILDQVTIPESQLTDAHFEELFGYRSTAPTDPLAAPASVPVVLLAQQAAQRSRWRLADEAQRDSTDPPLPIIDPDLLGEQYLRSSDPNDPVRTLWAQRANWLTTTSTAINARIPAAGQVLTVDEFDLLVKEFVPGLEVAELIERDAAGEDISADLQALGLHAFRYLADLRAALAGGALDVEAWQEVAAILLQATKLREYAGWREAERTAGVVLQPATFLLPALDPNSTLPRWRAEEAALTEWRATLEARTSQADSLVARFQAAVESAERRALPELRDALVTEIGSRRSTPETYEQAVERLSRELCIDLRVVGGQRTDRVAQAIDSVQSFLVSVRLGRLPATPPLTINNEANFDIEWDWAISYRRWHSVMQSFAYPENQLHPALFRPDPISTSQPLAPTQTFRNFVIDLAGTRRLDPHSARAKAAAFVAALRSEVGATAVPASLSLTDQRTSAELLAHRTLCASLVPTSVTAESQVAQSVRELFWLVPVTLARKLHESGEFAAALDWYQTVFGYQSPPAQRAIYRGLALEANTQSDYNRFPGWLAHSIELNPHVTGRKRKNAYTRFTVISTAQCLLAFADSEFARGGTDAGARARALYQSAVDVLDLPELAEPTSPPSPFPRNPMLTALRAEAGTGLAKLHAGLDIGGFPAVPTGDAFLPSQYRYTTVVERAKNLVAIAQQVEAAYFAALERTDAENYGLLQAGHDLRVAEAALGIQDLKVAGAETGVRLAELQLDKARDLRVELGKRLVGGLNDYESSMLRKLSEARRLQEQARVGSLLGGAFNIVASIAGGGGMGTGHLALASEYLSGRAEHASSLAREMEVRAGFQRRHQEWALQHGQAEFDVTIGAAQVDGALNQQALAIRERDLAGLQHTHAQAVAEFLATKFTNVELHQWMSGVLGRVYAYFLQQATALALLAQAQLAFERQEPAVGFIAADYWKAPAEPDTSGEPVPDRRGLTGSARLLQDIHRLDQHAFETDRRKLHLTQTLSLSSIAGFELQEFRQTGVLTFATPAELFDRDFPGHFLRLVKRIKVSMIALVPPIRGIRATLSASGLSRTVVRRAEFEPVTLRRDPESIAFTSPVDATGLFDLEPDNGMLLPFEGMGVDSVWRLELPKAANPFDYNAIADVLFTVEYTALDSSDYRRQVIRTLDRRVTGDSSFSVRNQFPDAWYELNNPDTVEDSERRMRIGLPLTADDFPPHIGDLAVSELTLFVVWKNQAPAGELTIPALAHDATVTDEVVTTGGIVSTPRPGGTAWRVLLGDAPTGDWEIRLPDTAAVRSWFADGLIEDVVLLISLSGTTPDWP